MLNTVDHTATPFPPLLSSLSVLLLSLLCFGGIDINIGVNISILSRVDLTLLKLFDAVKLFNPINNPTTSLPSLAMLLLSFLCLSGVNVDIGLLTNITFFEILNFVKLLDSINDTASSLSSLLPSFAILLPPFLGLRGVRVDIKLLVNVTSFKILDFVELLYTIDKASTPFAALLSAFSVLLAFLSCFSGVEGSIGFLDIAVFERCSGKVGEGFNMNIVVESVSYIGGSNMALVGNGGSTMRWLECWR